ncbi:hypothetical protein BKA57DRAFT_453129 [Linnemannia elongata]|nr:hypothetical protein BKA57DRAFT_453129 [Linnemannia elongata]
MHGFVEMVHLWWFVEMLLLVGVRLMMEIVLSNSGRERGRRIERMDRAVVVDVAVVVNSHRQRIVQRLLHTW